MSKPNSNFGTTQEVERLGSMYQLLVKLYNFVVSVEMPLRRVLSLDWQTQQPEWMDNEKFSNFGAAFGQLRKPKL